MRKGWERDDISDEVYADGSVRKVFACSNGRSVSLRPGDVERLLTRPSGTTDNPGLVPLANGDTFMMWGDITAMSWTYIEKPVRPEKGWKS